jgi:hypothetical protein
LEELGIDNRIITKCIILKIIRESADDSSGSEQGQVLVLVDAVMNF